MEDRNGMKVKWVADFHYTVICQELHHYVRIKDIVVETKQIVLISKLQPQFQNPLK